MRFLRIPGIMLEADFAEPAENEPTWRYFTVLSLTALTVIGIWWI